MIFRNEIDTTTRENKSIMMYKIKRFCIFKLSFNIQIINKLKNDAKVPGNFEIVPKPNRVEKKRELICIQHTNSD